MTENIKLERQKFSGLKAKLRRWYQTISETGDNEFKDRKGQMGQAIGRLQDISLMNKTCSLVVWMHNLRSVNMKAIYNLCIQIA